ncbi:phage baseplate assembly protein V [Desulfobacter curvatus]|uniref:phage baseplate assembly protein V n=1 Tax=Desulfobacter curvatus TaxID=2290 RepID=UPI00035DB38B|nr:phage baseplate assembly protein V [Desulfobacter curvatus]
MRPLTTLPDIDIEVNGEPLLPGIVKKITGITVIQKLCVPSVCEIEFSDDEGTIVASDNMVPGTEFTVNIRGEADPLFKGVFTATEYHYGPQGNITTSVRGYDPLISICKTQQTTTYTQVTASDIFKEMCDFKVLEKKALTEWERLVQFNESDIDFVTRICRDSGCFFFFHQNCINIFDLCVSEPDIHLTAGENLHECRFEVNSSRSLKSVYTNGWNPFLAELNDSKVSESGTGSNIDFQLSKNAENLASEKQLVDMPVCNTREAESLSRAALDISKASEISFSGTAEGTPQLFPGITAFVDKVAGEFKGNYKLTEVTHILNTQYGYISRFTTMPPENRSGKPEAVTTFGTVTDINDPENTGRIKVNLEAYNDTETGWLNVVLPASGKEKGLVMLPCVGDRVLVLFMNSNPGRGLVLGGVSPDANNSHKWGIDSGSVSSFSLISPLGQKLVLNDNEQTIVLENKPGSSIKLGPQRLEINSKTDVIIEASGKTITLKGANIDFTKG